MAHARRSRFQSRGVSSRRRVGWNAGPTQVPLNLSAAGASLWATGAQALLDGLTIVRIRGQFTLAITTTTTVLDGFHRIGLGICNVTENAFNAGVASVPQPLTDIGWDGWMWHQIVSRMTGFSTTEAGRGPMEAVRMEIDTKAMRKTRDTDVLVGVLEMGTEVGTSTVQFQASTRILDKLP